jgi:cell division septation protein DedD
MKKALTFIPLLIAVALAVTGCDFFRVLAGRPTSKEIEAKREIISRQEVAAPADTVKEVSAPVDEASPVVEEKETAADGKKRFYVVIASFSNPDNARKSLARMADRGYQGELLSLKGGFTGVGICGTDDEQEAKESLKQVKRQDFCPPGIWIIDRNKR